MRYTRWSCAPLVALVVPAPAYAVQYLTSEQVLRMAYPQADAFAPARVDLTPEQWRAVDRSAPAIVSTREPRVWIASVHGQPLGRLYVDEVLGKQLFITYAVAIDLDGRILRVEIMEYRETHGYEVRNARWLGQFAGATASSTLVLGDDIRNISGATLSCRHVTEGVRRLLAIHEALHAT